MSNEPSAETGVDAAQEQPVVLVVDDDEDIADTYAMWLRDRFDVVTAYGGHEALERVSEDVNAVLLDRRMPNMPGDEVLERIRERDLDCQVAMLTAVKPNSDLVDLQFDEYLTKPVAKSDVVGVIEDLLLREDLDEETREYLSLKSTARTLESQDSDTIRDPEAVDQVKAEAEAAAESPVVQRETAELERLRSVNELLRSVNRAVVDVDSKEALAESVAELMTEKLHYDHALVGEYTTAYDELFPEAVAGSDGDLDSVSCEPSGPIRTALDEGDARLVDPGTHQDHAVGRLTTRLAADDALRTALVVPINYRDSIRFVVVAWAENETELTDRERSTLREVGTTVGNAIDSIQTQQLVEDDSIVELELKVTDGSDFFVDLSMTHRCRVELEGVHRSSGEGIVCYVTVTEAPTDDVMEHLADAEGVDGARVIDDRGDVVLVECRVHDGSIVLELLETSGNVTRLVADDGEGHLDIEFASDVDLRTVLETIREDFPDVDLVSKRNVERSYESVEGFRATLESTLTERQDTVITAAANAGYFDWPRKSTAEEIAESLGMAPPTMHEHLREAERKLVDIYLEETSSGDRRGA
ncbi:bacterio-opsin activator domain-containing protein [Halopenitus persicus]|uniref:Predicted DNA binding protein, contains HTH domain n=1 Tax=Halopenitus persicus TaxID=1048396 RepID=A0A1H3FJQ6_9EURY|nr:bacterio-opsin activator domain-containing protein [Halopenitus persicus]SDX91333.1 Predicted DNA binding protein, contains HTH domain [Halopenitus persicus]